MTTFTSQPQRGASDRDVGTPAPPEDGSDALDLHCPVATCEEPQELGALTCTTHDRMLIVGGESEHETPRLILGAALVFTLVGVPASVGVANSYPLLVLALAFLSSLATVVLKRYPRTQRQVVLGLLAAAAVMILLATFLPQWTGIGLGLAMVAASLFSSVRSCRRLGLVGGLSAGITGIFLAATHAIAASVWVLLTAPPELLVEGPARSVIRVAVASMCVPILLAVVQGAVMGRRTPAPPVAPLLRPARRSRAPRFEPPDPGSSGSSAPTRFADRSALLMFRLMVRIESTFRRAVGAAVSGFVRTVNSSYAALVGFLRRSSIAIRWTWEAQRVALQFVGRATKRSVRNVVLPLIFSVLAVDLAISFAEQFHTYLDDGSFLALFATAVLATTSALCALTVAWLVSERPWREITKSTSCASSYYTPRLFVLWTLSAWVVGIGGVLGVSPIGVGLLTALATVVLAVSFARYLRQRSMAAST